MVGPRVIPPPHMMALARCWGGGLHRKPALAPPQRGTRTAVGVSRPLCRASLEGRSFLVTGSTDGIGKHTAWKLAKEGATVLIHGRDETRCQRVVERLRAETSNENVEAFVYDLSSLEQVRSFAEDVKTKHSKLDVLINNAGVFEEERRLSADGHEMTFAVNVLAPFLLTALLLDTVKRGSDPRIVNVSSISQSGSPIDFSNLRGEKGYSAHMAYSMTKLANAMFTYDLARILEGTGVTCNCLDPGTVNTKMLLSGWGPCGIEVGSADNEFNLATSPTYADVTGIYHVGGRASSGSPFGRDEEQRSILWSVCEEFTGATF